MKRYRLPMALVFCATASLIGQTGRDAYRQAYEVWQQAQSNLERDAGTGGATQVAQADRAAAAAASFEATRVAYLKSSAEQAEQRSQVLRTAATRSSPDLIPPSAGELAARELQTVTRAIAKFASDKDRAIQQLSQSLERERVALAALTAAIQTRQQTVEAASKSSDALEQARAKTAEAFVDQAAQRRQAVARIEMEGAAWAEYYDKLATAIQAANAPPPPPASVTTAAPTVEAAPRVPLVRYVGEWAYPGVNGIFHGVQPLSAELEVREKDGHIDGTLSARFKPSPGVTDPVLRFTFAGELAANPTQKFTLMTSDGTAGTIELIPGPAFNLLEINFQTDPRANKIRSANFIVLKK